MTIFASLITSGILILMAASCLVISERGLTYNTYERFLNNGNSCVAYLENQTVLSHKWILEAKQEYKVEFNILTVVTAQSARRIKRIYQFFGEQGFTYQQYIPCIDPFEENKGSLTYSLTPDRYGKFLKDLFDYWYTDWKEGHPVYNRTFENWVGMLHNYPPESCNMMGICSEQWVIEADGSVYPCDFYVLDDWKLGNIRENSFEEMNQAREGLDFVNLSRHVPDKCKECRWYPLCRNGCRRDRTLLPDGRTPGLNSYCESYQDFFSYAYPRLLEMARSIR